MVKHVGTATTHTFELDDREANLLAGYLWEALDKLEARNSSDDLSMRIQHVTEKFAKTVFEACGHDFTQYSGTNMFRATQPALPLKREAKK